MNTKRYEQSVKTVIVGDSGVGKTCILSRFVRDVFETDTSSTLGVEFMSKVIETKKRKIELQLWDTAGQELFRSVTKAYYRGSIGAFIVFDLTKKESFNNVQRWLADVKSTARPDVVCVLVGNKSDLVNERDVTSQEAEQFASENNIQYFETSAKTGDNVEKAMLSCLDSIEKLIDEGKLDGSMGNDPIEFSEENPAEQTKKPCC
ncbi:Ras-related protein Rab-14 [Histomonas meleagridis]|uniref:Ras-related protein Rab-14 n=1 Tax=Histomonas meleagridis TaxID=135588 RepID=UPI00355938EB|nr:Ras-related protein Rab-14 [Histomonas meleagridis]KAH0804586.1 Ras-related protein Rab-14 [Histomonas meleagridis]